MPIAFLKNNICVPTEVKISITRNQSCTASFHTENSSLHVVVAPTESFYILSIGMLLDIFRIEQLE